MYLDGGSVAFGNCTITRCFGLSDTNIPRDDTTLECMRRNYNEFIELVLFPWSRSYDSSVSVDRDFSSGRFFQRVLPREFCAQILVMIAVQCEISVLGGFVPV